MKLTESNVKSAMKYYKKNISNNVGFKPVQTQIATFGISSPSRLAEAVRQTPPSSLLSLALGLGSGQFHFGGGGHMLRLR